MFIHAFIERCTAVFVSEDNLPAVSAVHGFKTGNNAFGGTHSVNRRAHDSAGIACTFADRVKTLKPGCFAVLIPCNANRELERLSIAVSTASYISKLCICRANVRIPSSMPFEIAGGIHLRISLGTAFGL